YCPSDAAAYYIDDRVRPVEGGAVRRSIIRTDVPSRLRARTRSRGVQRVRRDVSRMSSCVGSRDSRGRDGGLAQFAATEVVEVRRSALARRTAAAGDPRASGL